MRLVASYIHPGYVRQVAVLKSLLTNMDKIYPTIMVGDFNCVLNAQLDTWNKNRKNTYLGKPLLLQLVNKLGLANMYQ